ncbi:type II toxin-antitoxin system RelE/ParE family toxin [Bradyrhizobium brasilense]|nr:type II toxin-antitoxin system RelE/ParE family toxin [Bradyrhizobium brasilense]
MLSDRDDIFSYIEARILARRSMLTNRLPMLRGARSSFLTAAGPGRVAGTRELVIPRTPYVASYLVDGETVRILRVLHGAQMWPDELTNDD